MKREKTDAHGPRQRKRHWKGSQESFHHSGFSGEFNGSATSKFKHSTSICRTNFFVQGLKFGEELSFICDVEVRTRVYEPAICIGRTRRESSKCFSREIIYSFVHIASPFLLHTPLNARPVCDNTVRNMVREGMWGGGDWHTGVVVARKSGLESVDIGLKDRCRSVGGLVLRLSGFSAFILSCFQACLCPDPKSRLNMVFDPFRVLRMLNQKGDLPSFERLLVIQIKMNFPAQINIALLFWLRPIFF